ncbi:MAG: aspartate/glutamate racemase family protein [Sphaerochaetaceae bacterium]
MKKIALIHTVPTVYLTFADELRKHIPDAIITNTLDDFLASDAEIRGSFSKTNRQRLYSLIDVAAKTDPDLIAITCSTLSPYVRGYREMFAIPLVTIDELMISEAIKTGCSILIVSTAESTVGPTKTKLLKEAELQHRTISIDNVVCNEAYTAIKKQNKALHDTIVIDKMKTIKKKYDVIVLAQASMAHLEEKVGLITETPVMSSPRFCIADILRVLKTN